MIAKTKQTLFVGLLGSLALACAGEVQDVSGPVEGQLEGLTVRAIHAPDTQLLSLEDVGDSALRELYGQDIELYIDLGDRLHDLRDPVELPLDGAYPLYVGNEFGREWAGELELFAPYVRNASEIEADAPQRGELSEDESQYYQWVWDYDFRYGCGNWYTDLCYKELYIYGACYPTSTWKCGSCRDFC